MGIWVGRRISDFEGLGKCNQRNRGLVASAMARIHHTTMGKREGV